MKRSSREQKHVFDALFVILLFFIFLICALSIVVIGSSVYNQVTQNMNEHFSNKTALSYIVEKVRQNDVAGGIELTEKEGINTLQISSQINEEEFVTFIYVLNGQLMELFVRSDNLLPLSAGETIMDVNAMAMERIQDGLISVEITDVHGNSSQVLLAERSVQ